MSKKIYGDLSSSGNIQINDFNTIRVVNTIEADENGNINIPFYDKSYIDNMLSMTPLTRVGTQDYLPFDVSGSYVGASTSYVKRGYPTVLENDGTLVHLRPGTNGSTEGFYYCYLKNARTVQNLTPVQTNTVYFPNFFSTNHKIYDFVASKADEVLFILSNNGTNDTYTIGLTNGTLNQEAHQFLEFNRNLIPNTNPNFVHIVNNIVYIWCIDSYNANDPYNISLYTILVSDVLSSSTSSLTQVTGFNGQNLFGSTVSSSNNIKITNKIASKSISDNPFIVEDANLNTNVFYVTPYSTLYAESDASENIRLSIVHRLYFQSSFGGEVTSYALSLVYNTSTKIYSFDTQNNGPILTSISGNTINVTNPYYFSLSDYNGIGDIIYSGNNLFQTTDGVVFSVADRYIDYDFYTILRSDINNFTNLYNSLLFSTRSLTNKVLTTVSPKYGSAIGSNLVNPTILSSSRVLFSSSGTENGVTFGFDNKVYTDIGSTRTFIYNSIDTGGTITGFAPQSNRHRIDNTDYRYSAMIQLIDASNNVSVYGSSFLEGNSKPVNGLLDINNFTFSNSYSLQNNALLTNLKNSIISSVTLPGNVIDSKIVLYYIPDNSFGDSISCVTLITDTTDSSGYNTFTIISKISVTTSSNTITALSSTYNNLLQRSKIGLSLDFQFLSRMTGLVVAKYSGFSYIGIPCITNVNIPGNVSYNSVIGKLDSSNNFVSMNPFSTYTLSSGNDFEVGVLPGVGFGVYTNALSDYQTKLVFKNSGTSSTNLDSLISNVSVSGENIVVAAQDVPQGFNIYFTQDVPVLLNGAFYNLKSTTIDLTDIDSSPANKTFYVYIVSLEGEINYLISTSLLSEELWRVYIGSISTNSTTVNIIDIEKVTRFLTYRTSTTKRGSAIPASTGVPTSTGTRWN